MSCPWPTGSASPRSGRSADQAGEPRPAPSASDRTGFGRSVGADGLEPLHRPPSAPPESAARPRPRPEARVRVARVIDPATGAVGSGDDADQDGQLLGLRVQRLRVRRRCAGAVHRCLRPLLLGGPDRPGPAPGRRDQHRLRRAGLLRQRGERRQRAGLRRHVGRHRHPAPAPRAVLVGEHPHGPDGDPAHGRHGGRGRRRRAAACVQRHQAGRRLAGRAGRVSPTAPCTWSRSMAWPVQPPRRCA